MCRLFSEWEYDIQKYCEENNLNFSEVQRAGKCFGSDFLILQYIDPAMGQHGLLDETPAPVVLMVHKVGDVLVFEQTEYTSKYLSCKS